MRADPAPDVWPLFEELVAADTSVSPGRSGVRHDDPRLLRFARDVVGPHLRSLGATGRIDARHNLVATFGPLQGSEVMLSVYPALHHANAMTDPWTARRTEIDGVEHWAGCGAGQGKAVLACLLSVLRTLVEGGHDLAGRVVVVLNSEGMSSNESSRTLFENLPVRPAGSVLLIGTRNRIALGHRGRVDADLICRGTTVHSSAAAGGPNPVAAVGRVLERIRTSAPRRPDHPLLGAATLTPYRLRTSPIAPHTIPEWCTATVERRYLPGEDAGEIVARLASDLDDLPVEVRPGPVMVPALVDPDDAVVTRLGAAIEKAGGTATTFYPRYTFDAGAGCAAGVPTIMWGPSSGRLDGTGVTDLDSVPAAQVAEALHTLHHLLAPAPSIGPY